MKTQTQRHNLTCMRTKLLFDYRLLNRTPAQVGLLREEETLQSRRATTQKQSWRMKFYAKILLRDIMCRSNFIWVFARSTGSSYRVFGFVVLAVSHDSISCSKLSKLPWMARNWPIFQVESDTIFLWISSISIHWAYFICS